MNMTRAAVAASCWVLIMTDPATGWAWNDVGHRKSVEAAIDVLPKQIKDFYKNRRDSLSEHIADPARREPRLLFEVDRLESFPFDSVPLTREAALSKYGEEAVSELGDLPWRILETYQKLVEAHRAADVPNIQKLSAEIAYYVGEMLMPLNLSQHGDGELIGQHGLRERFDSRMLELFADKMKLKPDSAVYLDRPEEYAMSIVRRTYVWVDNVLLADYLSNQGTTSYGRYYFEGLWRRSAEVATLMLNRAAEDIGSFWYTAWVAAGKPDLPK